MAIRRAALAALSAVTLAVHFLTALTARFRGACNSSGLRSSAKGRGNACYPGSTTGPGHAIDRSGTASAEVVPRPPSSVPDTPDVWRGTFEKAGVSSSAQPVRPVTRAGGDGIARTEFDCRTRVRVGVDSLHRGEIGPVPVDPDRRLPTAGTGSVVQLGLMSPYGPAGRWTMHCTPAGRSSWGEFRVDPTLSAHEALSLDFAGCRGCLNHRTNGLAGASAPLLASAVAARRQGPSKVATTPSIGTDRRRGIVFCSRGSSVLTSARRRLITPMALGMIHAQARVERHRVAGHVGRHGTSGG